MSASSRSSAFEAFFRALSMGREGVIKEIEASGLRGMGGAGFPAGRKWRTVAEAPSEVRYAVMNADEGEPGTFKDKYLMENHPGRVVEGLMIAAYAVNAERAYIYIRHEYARAYRALAKARDRAMAAADGRVCDIEIFRSAGGYICGEESALLESLAGERAEPLVRPPFPAVSGLYGKPTLVNNVETLVNTPDIIMNGADWYKDNVKKLFSVSGDVRKPGVFARPPGATLRELVYEDAGGMKNGHAFRFAIVGGYSGKVLTAGEMDEPLEFGEFGNGAVIVLDESRNALETAQNVAEFFAGESCGKCAPCRGGTSSMPLLLAEIKAGRKTGGARALIRRLSNAMRDTSLCGLGQTAPNVVEELIDKYPHDFMDSGKRRPRSI